MKLDPGRFVLFGIMRGEIGAEGVPADIGSMQLMVCRFPLFVHSGEISVDVLIGVDSKLLVVCLLVFFANSSLIGVIGETVETGVDTNFNLGGIVVLPIDLKLQETLSVFHLKLSPQ